MKVKFVPQNIELEVTPDKSLLQIATENHIDIKSICKGVPSCAECRVRVVEGENNVLPPSKPELNLIGTNWRIDSRRLSCQLRCFGDVTVDLTEQIEKQESQTKKVRGFRSQKQVESHAVQDTMLLTEKPDDKVFEKPAHHAKESRDDRQEGSQEGRQENRPQQQKQQHHQQKQQGQKQKQHQQQGQQRQQQGGQQGQKPQGQKQQGGKQGQGQQQGQKPKQQHHQHQQQKQNKNPNQQQQQQQKPQNQK